MHDKLSLCQNVSHEKNKANYYDMSKHHTTLGGSRVACDSNVIPKDARMVGTWC